MVDIVESNIDAMHRRLAESRMNCRPHIKVHRVPELAQMQVSAGAVGIACQTLDEVDSMVAAGFREILLTNSLVDTKKLSRLSELMRYSSIAVTADSNEAIETLAQVAAGSGQSASVYVECDIGDRRTGFADPYLAAELAITISRSPSLEFAGLAAYRGGNPKCSDIDSAEVLLAEVVSRLDHAGLEVPVVSVGGTVFAQRAWPDCPADTVTEARPGNYAFYDATKVAYGLVSYEDCALRVVSTVISRPGPTRVVLDAGWHILSNNPTPADSTYGHILDYPQARITGLYTEHALVELSEASELPRIGDQVTIIPNSCDGVLASVDMLYGIRSGEIDRAWHLKG
jgi:D-serine deaminase-like pyridoxal phosphate-dependent protein